MYFGAKQLSTEKSRINRLCVCGLAEKCANYGLRGFEQTVSKAAIEQGTTLQDLVHLVNSKALVKNSDAQHQTPIIDVRESAMPTVPDDIPDFRSLAQDLGPSPENRHYGLVSEADVWTHLIQCEGIMPYDMYPSMNLIRQLIKEFEGNLSNILKFKREGQDGFVVSDEFGIWVTANYNCPCRREEKQVGALGEYGCYECNPELGNKHRNIGFNQSTFDSSNRYPDFTS